MAGFDKRLREAYWADKVQKKQVEKVAHLFDLSYDIMRMNHQSVYTDQDGKDALDLTPRRDFGLTYFKDQVPDGCEEVEILVPKVGFFEVFSLERGIKDPKDIYGVLRIDGYRSTLTREPLDFEVEYYPEGKYMDNLVMSLWRAHLTLNP